MNKKISKEFSELIGAFVGDGWISQGNTGKTLVISGSPKDEKEYYERIRYLFEMVFEAEVRPRHFEYWKTFGIMVCKKNIINEFIKVGLPVGHKSSIVDAPKQIIDNSFLHIPFIRGFFDTDGCIYFKKSYNFNASKWQKSCRHRPVILLCSTSKRLIDSLDAMLRLIDFKFRHEKPQLPGKRSKHTAYRLTLEGKKNAERFFDIIKPKNLKHINKFNLWLKQGFY